MPTGFPKKDCYLNTCVSCGNEFKASRMYTKHCTKCLTTGSNYCRCGCGRLCRKTFVSGHNNKGIKFSKQHRDRMSLGLKGKRKSLQAIKKLKESLKNFWKGRKLKKIKHWNWIDFETRACLCGCGQIFECKATSKHCYIRNHHRKGKPSFTKHHSRNAKAKIAKKLRKIAKGKTWQQRYNFTDKQYEEMKLRSRIAHSGWHHTEKAKKRIGKASRKTILRSYMLGRFKFINTKPHKKLVEEMKKARIWNKHWFNEYSFYHRYSIDIANNIKKIAIFVDGDYWHANPKKFKSKDILSKGSAKDIWKKDRRITKYVKSKGWKVLRFWESTVLNNSNFCIKKIKSLL